MQEAGVKFGAIADVIVTNKDTGATQVAMGLTNSLYPDITNTLFKGLAKPTFSVGENDSDVNPSNGRLVKPIPTTSTITPGVKSMTRVSESEIMLTQILNVQIANDLADGDNRYIREMGIDDFDRFVVKTSRGRKYALMVDNKSVIDITMTLNITFKITSPTISIRVKEGSKVYQTLDCVQRIHVDSDLSWFKWNTFLSGSQDAFLRLAELDNRSLSTDVTKDQTSGVTPSNVNVSSPGVNRLIFEHNCNVSKNTVITQLRATMGYTGIWISLTPTGKFLLPNEINLIKIQMGIK